MDIKQKPAADFGVDNVSSDMPYIEGSISNRGAVLTHDEYHLATLGYKQEFFRSLGFFESWAATFISMNIVSGIVSDLVSSTHVSVVAEVGCGLKIVKQGKEGCLLSTDQSRLQMMKVIVGVEIRANEEEKNSHFFSVS